MNTSWTWSFNGYDPKKERLVEALCTLGNGRFATRGAGPEATAGPVHYPGTYAAGCYDWLPTRIAGRQVGNEDLVNLPDWSRLRYRCVPDDGPQGDWLTPDHPTLRHCGTTLDLRDGVLTRRMLFQDGHGRRLGVTHTRLVHMGDPYLAAQRTTFRAYGWSGTIEAQAVLDGDVTNAGVERYRDLDGHHLTGHRTEVGTDGVAGPSSPGSATTSTVTSGARRSSTTWSAPATGRPSAAWCTGGSSPGRRAPTPGGTARRPCSVMWRTSRAAPPAKESTWVPWQGPST